MNVSSVKNLNGEAFSAVQDATLTDVVQTNSAQWNEISAYEQNSASYITAHQSLEGYATEQWVGEQGYLTAVDLTPYQTTAGMTAYQPAGDYATTNDLEQVSGDITATIPSTAGLASESYVQTNSAVLTGMIDAKQDALTFGYDEQDRINSINNSALAGGGDVPEGTMVESNLEYNSQGYINGYNGSAVADQTLTNIVSSNSAAWGGSAIPVSAGEGVKIDYTNGVLVFKQDRTQLYSGTTQVTGFTASEPLTNFERVEFVVSPDPYSEGPSIITYPMTYQNTARVNLGWVGNFNGWRNISWNYLFNTNDMTVFTSVSGSYFGLQANGTTAAGVWNSDALLLLEVNGINRKA